MSHIPDHHTASSTCPWTPHSCLINNYRSFLIELLVLSPEFTFLHKCQYKAETSDTWGLFGEIRGKNSARLLKVAEHKFLISFFNKKNWWLNFKCSLVKDKTLLSLTWNLLIFIIFDSTYHVRCCQPIWELPNSWLKVKWLTQRLSKVVNRIFQPQLDVCVY